ncbi:MAG TPA: hypothetical protein VM100_13970 [Longimicrobiales bacterium]|nr:hypothetical protein [Longimicrobiales bacterium]
MIQEGTQPSYENDGTLKKRPNHSRYLEILRRMSPEERLAKAFELSEFAKALFVNGLKKRRPDLTTDEFARLLRTRLEKCHNRNY